MLAIFRQIKAKSIATGYEHATGQKRSDWVKRMRTDDSVVDERIHREEIKIVQEYCAQSLVSLLQAGFCSEENARRLGHSVEAEKEFPFLYLCQAMQKNESQRFTVFDKKLSNEKATGKGERSAKYREYGVWLDISSTFLRAIGGTLVPHTERLLDTSLKSTSWDEIDRYKESLKGNIIILGFIRSGGSSPYSEEIEKTVCGAVHKCFCACATFPFQEINTSGNMAILARYQQSLTVGSMYTITREYEVTARSHGLPDVFVPSFYINLRTNTIYDNKNENSSKNFIMILAKMRESIYNVCALANVHIDKERQERKRSRKRKDKEKRNEYIDLVNIRKKVEDKKTRKFHWERETVRMSLLGMESDAVKTLIYLNGSLKRYSDHYSGSEEKQRHFNINTFNKFLQNTSSNGIIKTIFANAFAEQSKLVYYNRVSSMLNYSVKTFNLETKEPFVIIIIPQALEIMPSNSMFRSMIDSFVAAFALSRIITFNGLCAPKGQRPQGMYFKNTAIRRNQRRPLQEQDEYGEDSSLVSASYTSSYCTIATTRDAESLNNDSVANDFMRQAIKVGEQELIAERHQEGEADQDDHEDRQKEAEARTDAPKHELEYIISKDRLTEMNLLTNMSYEKL